MHNVFPDPDDDEHRYLVTRAKQNIDYLDWLVRQENVEPEDLFDQIESVQKWLRHIISLERTVYPTVLPPGIGALYSMDYILEPENETVAELLRFLDRTEVLYEEQVKELRFRKMFASWFEPDDENEAS